MIRVCYICGRTFGEKEPLEDKGETSGICPDCLPGELRKVEEYMKSHSKEEDRDCQSLKKREG